MYEHIVAMERTVVFALNVVPFGVEGVPRTVTSARDPAIVG